MMLYDEAWASRDSGLCRGKEILEGPPRLARCSARLCGRSDPDKGRMRCCLGVGRGEEIWQRLATESAASREFGDSAADGCCAWRPQGLLHNVRYRGCEV